MTESHVAAASALAGIPQNNGNPPPGQFPYGNNYAPCATTDTLAIPLAGLDHRSGHRRARRGQAPGRSTFVYSDNTNTTVTATTALPSGKVLPFASTDAWEASGDPADPTPSTWDNGVGVGTFQFADSIWQSYRVQTPALDETVTFERSFNIPGPIAPGSSMKVTTDDAYTASLNGTQVASDCGRTGRSVEAASPFAPVTGANELVFVSTNSNLSNGASGTINNNPGGLIYEAQINYYDKSESAWADTAPNAHPFPGRNWATYINYTLQDVLLDTVTVPSTDSDGVDSNIVLASGKNYIFTVTGTTTWLNRGGLDVVDAECASESGGPWTAAAAGYPDDLLELQVNSIDRNWTPVGTFNGAGCADGHEYTLPFAGTGSAATFRIYDGTGNVRPRRGSR